MSAKERGPGSKENLVVPEYKVEVIISNTILSNLSILREASTTTDQFQESADSIFFELGTRLAQELPLIESQITTPVAETKGYKIDTKNTLLVAVLRSGDPMCEGIDKAFGKQIPIAMLDVKRDEETAQPILKYDGLPQDLSEYKNIYIPDPMLATGGSAELTIGMLLKRGAKIENINLVSLVSAPEGIKHINELFPEVKIYTCSVDDELNDKFYISPGLGDFGDRYFGDEPLTIIDALNGKMLKYQKGQPLEVTDLEITERTNLP